MQAHQLIADCEAGNISGEAAQSVLDLLNHSWSNFADEVASELLRRARTLRLLEDAGAPNEDKGLRMSASYRRASVRDGQQSQRG